MTGVKKVDVMQTTRGQDQAEPKSVVIMLWCLATKYDDQTAVLMLAFIKELFLLLIPGHWQSRWALIYVLL